MYDFEKDFSTVDEGSVDVKTKGILKSNLFDEVSYMLFCKYADFCMESKKEFSEKKSYLNKLIESASNYILNYSRVELKELRDEIVAHEEKEKDVETKLIDLQQHVSLGFATDSLADYIMLQVIKEKSLLWVSRKSIESRISLLSEEIDMLSRYNRHVLDSLFLERVYASLERTLKDVKRACLTK